MAKHPHDSKRPVRESMRKAIDDNDIDAVERGLTVRQRAFAREYVVDYHGAAACIRAGYSVNPESAKRMATMLLRHEGIQAYITALTASKEAKILSISPDYVIRQVLAIVNADSAKDGDRLRGLELLARHLGMFIDRTEISGVDGGPIEMDQRVQEEAANFTAQLRGLQERADSDKKTLN